ncbi:MAG TPA: hypothetical protein VNZ01_04560 [Solirubrobacteraceae bacterium]|jgi:hypothetical protein|nr:hypothetical protein [Solirubrobacteraceae bacterium]
MSDQPVPMRNHLTDVVRFSPRQIKRRVSEVEGFNAKFAVIITSGVGTMACAYAFALLAFVSLPAILIQANVLKKSDVPVFFTKPGLILIVSWIAQTFLQLVLLSIILVGQRVQSAASDARALKEFEDTQVILDRLDTKTQGGLTDVLTAIKALDGKSAA